MSNPRQRSNPRLKPKFPRIQRLLAKRRTNHDWYATADDEGNVRIHPANNPT